MDNLSYNPLFDNVILKNILWFVDDASLRFVHSFWNSTYLYIYKKPLHPWFQTFKNLQTRGTKCSFHIYSHSETIFCKYKGIFIQTQQSGTLLTIFFADFSLNYCTKYETDIRSKCVHWIDLARITWHFTNDKLTHYLLLIRLPSDESVLIDYTDINNIFSIRSSSTYKSGGDAFKLLFSKFYQFNVHPSDLFFFDLDKLQYFDKTSEKYFIVHDKIMFVKFFDNKLPRIYQAFVKNQCDKLKKCTLNHEFHAQNCHLWNNFLIFEGHTQVLFYRMFDFDKPYIILNQMGNDDESPRFIPLNQSLIAFQRLDKMYVVDVNTKSYQIVNNSPVFHHTQRFLQLDDHTFICYDFDLLQNKCMQITIDLLSKNFQITNDIKEFYDYNLTQ